MANVLIDQLTQIASHALTDLLEIEDAGGNSWKTTLQKLAQFLGRWWAGNVPTAASLTIVSGDATNPTFTDDADAGLLFHSGVPVSGDKMRGGELTIANPSADWTWTVRMDMIFPNTNYSNAVIWARDTVSGKIIEYGISQSGALAVNRITSLSGPFSANVTSVTVAATQPPWLRVQFTASSSTLTFFASMEGKKWATIGTETVSSFLTNNANRVGIGARLNRTSGISVLGSIQYAKLA